MTTVLHPLKTATEERFVLRGVSWATYEQILKDHESRSVPHFTYDQGDLEIMSPSIPHERAGRILALLINVICEEREIDVQDLGSTTHKRIDLLKGVEPDGCFYIQNVEAIADRRELDLAVSPPADLVIEIDITSPSVAKLPIYAAIGVPEIWHFENDDVRFLRLCEDQYISITESVCLPRMLAQDVTRLIGESGVMKRPEWLREVRQWIRSVD